MSNRQRKWVIAAIVVSLLVIDQLIKFYVKLNMPIGGHFGLFGNSSWAQILFIENNGMAFGMQLGGVWGKVLLSLVRLVLIALIIWYINRLVNKGRASWGVLIGVALILVGAVGNIIDSAFYGRIFTESSPTEVASLVPYGQGYAPFLQGKVVDMFYFPMIHGVWPDWVPGLGGRDFEFFRPVFNFADACISCGVIYLLLFQRRFFAKTENAEQNQD